MDLLDSNKLEQVKALSSYLLSKCPAYYFMIQSRVMVIYTQWWAKFIALFFKKALASILQ